MRDTAAPFAYREIPLYYPLRVVAFIGSDQSLVSANQAYIAIQNAGNQGIYARGGFNVVSGVPKIESRGYDFRRTTIDATNVSNGFWVAVEALSERTYRTMHDFTSPYTTDPRALAWTMHKEGAAKGGEFPASNSGLVRVGFLMENESNGALAAFPAWLKALHVEYLTPTIDTWGMQARTTSPVDQVFPEADLGGASAVFTDAMARAYAVAVTNRRRQDNGTVTWRFTRGMTGLSGSGSWYAANAIEVQGSGRYLLIEARGTSDGSSVYSVRLNVPIIPGAA